NSELFSIEINFKGTLGEWGYYNGQQGWIDHVDGYHLSLVELKSLAVDLGEKDPVTFLRLCTEG
ncbi:hypothetical protein LINPERPRIM_LOCUS367, partial [Linum perenne]